MAMTHAKLVDKFSAPSYAKGYKKGAKVARMEAEGMAGWLEGALRCPNWDWSPDQEAFAWQTLNDWRASVGYEVLTPSKSIVFGFKGNVDK